MRILLCLLSDQQVPNLLSVHHFQPDRLVLIESVGMQRKQAAAHLLAALQLGGHDFSQRCEVQPLEAEDSLEAVGRALRHAFGRYPDEDWIANVTGGTKPMSLAAYEFFKAIGARIVYVNAARPNEFLALDGRAAECGSHTLAIPEFLGAYGFESGKSEAKLNEAESRAVRCWPAARLIAEQAADQNLLLNLTRDEWRQVREKGWELRAGDCDHLPVEVRSALADVFALHVTPSGLVGKIDKYAGKFLTGEWLEVFLWQVARRHADSLGLSSVRLGVEARKLGTSAATDFDVAFMRNQSLCAIECKSGSQEQADDPNVPLDKLEARIQQFRALRVNSWLATTAGKILDSAGQLKPAFQARAAIYGCRVITLPQIRRLAQEHESPDAVQSILFPPGGAGA